MSDKPAAICFPFVGDTLGGSHFSAVTFMQSLDGERYRPLVVVHQEGPLTRYLDELGLAYRILPLRRVVGRSRSPLGQLGAILVTLPILVRFLRRNKVALVHTNDARMHLTWTLPARLAGAAAIWHQRSRAGGSRLEALMLRFASRVIAISRFVAAGLPAHARSKANVIANPVAAPEGLDRDRCRAALVQELGLSPETRLIGLFGNLTALKRPLLFVETAARLVPAGDPALAFVVFGEDREGAQAAMAARAAELGIGGQLHFMGFRRPVWPWMAACDVMVAPSEGDGFGRTLVEAMLCGTAVVASESGGHREIVDPGRTGLLVAGDDPAAYAEAVARLLEDPPLRDALVRQARETARSRYDAGPHATAVATLYGQCLDRRAERASRSGESSPSLALVIADLGCGGAQRVLTRLAGAWADAGRMVTVVTLAGPDRDFFALPAGVRRVALDLQQPSQRRAGALWSNLMRLLALRRAIRESRAASVLSFVAATNVLTILATRGLGCRVVIGERNDPARQSLGPPWDWLRRRLYRYADAVTANSRDAIATLGGYVPEEKLAYVPNPLSLPEVLPDAAARQPVILAVGRLDRQKGFDLLLQAFALCQARRSGWHLAVLGDGPLRAELAAQAEALGLAGLVEWCSLSPDPTEHYRRAGLFVLPSRYEGTPNALLEAMAFGVPVIVTQTCGGALQVVADGETGLVVPGEQPEALASALDRLAGDPALRSRLGRLARQSVKRYRLDRVLPLWNGAVEGST